MLNEAGIYGPLTIGQIFEGKHIKRGMEANMIICLSLFKVYVDNVLERYPDLCQEMINKANNYPPISAQWIWILRIAISTKSILKQKLSSEFLIYMMNLSINKHSIWVTTWLCMKYFCCLHEHHLMRTGN